MSQRFTTADGSDWLVAIDIGGIKAVKKLTGVDIPRLLDDRLKGLTELMADPVLLVDVLYVLCRGQCEQRKLTDEAFGRLFASGDVVRLAAFAFCEALADFLPAGQQQAVRKTLQAAKEVSERTAAAFLTAVENLDLEAIVQQQLGGSAAPTSGGSSTSTPASSASTPTPEPSPS